LEKARAHSSGALPPEWSAPAPAKKSAQEFSPFAAHLIGMVAMQFRPRQRAAVRVRRHTVGTFRRHMKLETKLHPSIRKDSRIAITQRGVPTMTYRVYSGPRGSQSISPLEKDRHLFKEFSLLDEAMGWARHINESGRVALLVDGDDGTRLTKQQIVTALKSLETREEHDHAA